MKKGILACLLCCILMIFSGCSTLIDMLMEKDGSGIFNKIINGRTMGIYDYVLEFCEGK